MAAKSADQARAQAAAKAKAAADKAAAVRAEAAKAAAAKAAAAKTAAAKAAATKQATSDAAAIRAAAIAKGKAKAEADAKELAYIANFENPITSQYDPRIIEGGRIDSAGNVVKFNPEMVGMTSFSSTTKKIGDGNDGNNGDGNGNTTVNPADNPVYAALLASLSIYNISGLADTLLAIRTAYPDITSEDMLSLLRYDKRYNTGYLQRFAGNAKLIANKKAPLDEKTYLANEAAYEKIFKAYDVKRFANTSQYAELIGNELAPDEVGSRVSMAYNRVINGDVKVLEALRQFAPALSTGDLVAYVLDPRNQLPELNKKITSAEIGGAALRQGLEAYEAATSIKSSRYSNVMGGTIGTEEARRAGADAASAKEDYQKIARELPTMEFLSSISKGLPQYAQKEAEQATILGLASAERKKQDLIALERSRFTGSSGNIGSKSYRTSAQGIV